MDNNEFSDFDLFINDLRSGATIESERSLEQIAKDTPREMTARDLLAAHTKDINRVKPPDPFKGEQEVMQMRIDREVRKAAEAEPTLKVPNLGTFSGEAKPEHDLLMEMLDREIDPELPIIAARLPDHGRVVEGAPTFAKVGGKYTSKSFLDQPLASVLTAVAERMPGGPGREFAEKLAAECEGEL